MKKRIIISIILTYFILLYCLLHTDVEVYIYSKTKEVNVVMYDALIRNIWYGWLLIALEVVSVAYYIWHYRHDVAFRFWHLWAFVIINSLLFLTDRKWDIILSYCSWYSFANITIVISTLGIVGSTATYFINRKKEEKEEYHSNIDNRRKEYAKTIVEGLTKAKNLNGSYAIGICGGWGSGKTTFLKEIERLLKEEYCDVCWFNAWDCSSEQNISSDFFVMLRAAIKPYCSSLNQSIFDYEAALTDAGVPSFMRKMTTWIVGDKNKSINDLKNQIRNALVKTGHDLYIIIDDLDRMEAGEILEVLKLIRNNADFPHLKFIVAYDKVYVKSQILDITKKDGYLNKIFMAEYFLPKLSDSDSTFDLIYKTLSHIGEKNKTILSGMIKHEDRQLVESALGSLRKAEIFARQFDINYKFVISGIDSSNFHIADFFWLELLKKTDAKIYELMDCDPDKLFMNQRCNNGVLYYVLRKAEDLNNLQISPTTMSIINKLLFDGNRPQSVKRMMFLENYPNYFAMGLTSGKLHRTEFVNLINGNNDNDAIIKIVYEWINNGKYASLLNRILMSHLDKLNIEQAKKMVMCAIAYCFRASGNKYYIDQIVDNCFRNDSYKEDVREELQTYATDVINSYTGHHKIWLSMAVTMVRVTAKIKQERMMMLWDENFCTEVLKQNFLSYLKSENPDASEIFDESKMLHKIVKSSCRNYTISTQNEYDEDEHYHVQYIAEELLSWFGEHKSNNKNCIQKFKYQYEVKIDMGDYTDYDFDQERYDYDVLSIFGGFDVFKRFENECFEEQRVIGTGTLIQ